MDYSQLKIGTLLKKIENEKKKEKEFRQPIISEILKNCKKSNRWCKHNLIKEHNKRHYEEKNNENVEIVDNNDPTIV